MPTPDEKGRGIPISSSSALIYEFSMPDYRHTARHTVALSPTALWAEISLPRLSLTLCDRHRVQERHHLLTMLTFSGEMPVVLYTIESICAASAA